MGEISSQNVAMEGLMKQVLDSLDRMQTKIDEIQEQITATSAIVASGQQTTDALTTRLTALEISPRTALKHVATATNSSVPVTEDGDGADPLRSVSSLPFPSGVAAARTSASAPNSGSVDHRDPMMFRGDAPGIIRNQRSALFTGTNPFYSGKSIGNTEYPECSYERERDHSHEGRGATPKMDFPKFDGENPNVWQLDYETYFEIYHVKDSLRTRYATLDFRGTTALWLRNVRAKKRLDDWGEMCRLVHEKFGKNKYMHYRHQLASLASNWYSH